MGDWRVVRGVPKNDGVDIFRDVERAASEVCVDGVPARHCIVEDLVEVMDIERGGHLCLPARRLLDDCIGCEIVSNPHDNGLYRCYIDDLPVEHVYDDVKRLETL